MPRLLSLSLAVAFAVPHRQAVGFVPRQPMQGMPPMAGEMLPRARPYAAPRMERQNRISRLFAAGSSAETNENVDEMLSLGRNEARSNPQAALAAFQRVVLLPSDIVSPQQRQAAFWNTACIFLKFGDIDKAEQSLANARRLGMDFEKAKMDPNLLPLQGSSARVEEELWRKAREMMSQGPETIKLSPEMEAVTQDLTLAEGQDLRFTSIARRVALLTLGGMAAMFGLGALLFPGLRSPEPSPDYYELPDDQ
eukprot:CAMPEP_0170177748 /NCGR_PEP_ID=MMETSP0040_2-20121228/10947_1 /TAXON_ID=641309 /ORGANISM="Lotharella oceanica, Strain CCMP622" /LENGTH=251 /DNA_ID=CAMNT_0010420515 /DNA_START=42 /DNA_END=800 /DNA_ORIENTATION=+